ncbi:MAG: bifunctional helix-turn-helix transcriptional regulator/GNAT family N-acetyltransferase [Novosphingobium sp.]|uniref:bifunctional helix-turn-helix transcriptional regulator/GNAT family N-acetyltransferase n=1 Tax=Novosphingobium sp. TaxID=1874826 RepID=UPI0032BAD16F
MTDLVAAMGPAFLGTRLKRLGERMQAGAAEVIAEAGLPIVPAQVSVLAALRSGPQTIGQIAESIKASQPGVTRIVGQLKELGLVESASNADQRKNVAALTPSGNAAVAVLAKDIWPRVGMAAQELFAGLQGDFLHQIAEIEQALSETPLSLRAKAAILGGLTLREWEPALARYFRDINAEWIEAMFELEEADRVVLNNPQEKIVNPGGTILFVEAPGLGIVGACALKPDGSGAFELTKMGVREAARGLKAGEFLLEKVIERAGQMGIEELYLLTSKKCEAAIHLYEKLGFVHDAGIMEAHGAEYCRCDVAMRYIAG